MVERDALELGQESSFLRADFICYNTCPTPTPVIESTDCFSDLFHRSPQVNAVKTGQAYRRDKHSYLAFLWLECCLIFTGLVGEKVLNSGQASATSFSSSRLDRGRLRKSPAELRDPFLEVGVPLTRNSARQGPHRLTVFSPSPCI